MSKHSPQPSQRPSSLQRPPLTLSTPLSPPHLPLPLSTLDQDLMKAPIPVQWSSPSTIVDPLTFRRVLSSPSSPPPCTSLLLILLTLKCPLHSPRHRASASTRTLQAQRKCNSGTFSTQQVTTSNKLSPALLCLPSPLLVPFLPLLPFLQTPQDNHQIPLPHLK